MAGDAMRRPYVRCAWLRRGEACLALLQHAPLWMAGDAMRRPYERF